MEFSFQEKMKQEEEKLKKKYPNMKAGVGGSALLSKRLQKVQVNQILRSNLEHFLSLKSLKDNVLKIFHYSRDVADQQNLIFLVKLEIFLCTHWLYNCTGRYMQMGIMSESASFNSDQNCKFHDPGSGVLVLGWGFNEYIDSIN